MKARAKHCGSRLAALAVLALGIGCASSTLGKSVAIEFAAEPRSDELAMRAAAAFELRAFEAQPTDANLSDITDTLLRNLRADGFASAEASFELRGAEGSAAGGGVIRVTEGPRAFIGKVTFPGASSIPTKELAKEFVPERTPFQLSASPLRQSRIDQAVATALSRYRAAGFAHATVGPAAVRWNADRTLADVEVPVAEGRRWTISSVHVVGALDDELSAALVQDLALVGAPYVETVARTAAVEVRRFLGDRGYLRAAAEGTVTTEQRSATAALEVNVVLGPKFRVGEVVIEGLDRMRPGFAASLLPLTTGEVLTDSDLRAAVDALRGTGVFDDVTVTPELGPPEFKGTGKTEQIADVLAKVHEVEARTVDFEIGWGSYELLRGRVRYLDRDFLGRASTFDTEVSASFRGVGTAARWEDGYILGKDNTLVIRGEAHTREQPTFIEDAVAVEASVRHRLGATDALTGGYRFRATRATDVSGSLRGAERGGFVTTAGLFTRYERDRRDDRFFPRNGYLVDTEVFWSDPSLGADLNFVEFTAGASRYFALGERTVLVLAARGTTREILDDRRTLPIQERLFLGGENSVRSFGQDELAPLNSRGRAAGGLSALEAHVELRRRLAGDLDGALFFDVGYTSPDSFDTTGPPGEAIGVGLRYRLPVGPIRFDVGYNPGALYAADSRWALHLSFGFAF